MHPSIRKRVYALKNLQKETIKFDAEFHRGVYDLERNFQGKHDEVFKKRKEIINGNYEPLDDECKLSGVELNKIVPAEGQNEGQPKGIPNFWLQVLKNVAEISSMIQEQDEEVLKYLTDIRAFSMPSPNLSFQLEFHFAPNPFFQNSILTKTYLMKCTPDEEDPFGFEGPEIYKSIGCEIMWNAGKKVTDLAINKMESSLRIFKAESFFNFFSPPELNMNDIENNEKIEAYLENDFEIGHYLKERVVPRAVLYFTGEIDDDISDDDDDGDESINFHAENYEDVEHTEV